MSSRINTAGPVPSVGRWWLGAMLIGSLTGALYVWLGDPGPSMAPKAWSLVAGTTALVVFCRPARFFHRLGWTMLLLLGAVVGLCYLQSRVALPFPAVIEPIVANARWMSVVFAVSATLFLVLDHIQHRDPKLAAINGEQVEIPEEVETEDEEVDDPQHGARRKKKRQRALDRETLEKIHGRYATALQERLRHLPVDLLHIPQAQFEEDTLEAAFSRVVDLAERENQLASEALKAVRCNGDLSIMQQLLATEMDRLGENLDHEAGDFININHELAVVAELQSDRAQWQKCLDSISHLTPAELDPENTSPDLHIGRGQLEAAHRAYRRILSYSMDEDWRVASYSQLGLVMQAWGAIEESERYHLKALAIDRKRKNFKGLATHYGHLGAVYMQAGRLAHAERMLDLALEIDERLDQEQARQVCEQAEVLEPNQPPPVVSASV